VENVNVPPAVLFMTASPAVSRGTKGPQNLLSSTLSGDAWRKWKDFVFPVEGNFTASKSKQRLEARRTGKTAEVSLPKKVRRSAHPPLERLVFAGLKAADDPTASDEIVAEITAEVQKQLDFAERSRVLSIQRVENLQEAKDALREELASVNLKRAAVRQAYLQKRTAGFEDQSRKTDESIGVDSDIDCTIEFLREELEAVTDEVQYLRDAFGALEGDAGGRPADEEEEDPAGAGDEFE
jgi:hypothetical protein